MAFFCSRVFIVVSRRLPFELTRDQRQDARPGPQKMYTVPVARAWWLAVGPRLERRVRPGTTGSRPPTLALMMCYGGSPSRQEKQQWWYSAAAGHEKSAASRFASRGEQGERGQQQTMTEACTAWNSRCCLPTCRCHKDTARRAQQVSQELLELLLRWPCQA